MSPATPRFPHGRKADRTCRRTPVSAGKGGGARACVRFAALGNLSRPRGRCAAFTLAEILVTLAVLGLLLTAVTGAFNASLQSYQENEKLARLTQTGRAVLDRMTAELRGAEAIDYDGAVLTILPPDDGSGLEQIQYEVVDGSLMYRRTVSGSTTSHAMIAADDEVTLESFEFTREIGDDSEGVECTVNSRVRIVLRNDERSMTVTASAAPRKNQVY